MTRTGRALVLMFSVALSFGAAAADPPVRHLVVLNKPGPRFETHPQNREAVIAHRELYEKLAARGDILVGGRMVGTGPVWGLSVFRLGVDREAIRRTLESDPIVTAGILELEFLEWELHMGGFGAR